MASAGLWVTETGWGSSTGSNPLEVGPSGQAQRLGEVYRYFARERNRLNVKTVIWFSWRDSSVSICAWCASSGLLDQIRPARSPHSACSSGWRASKDRSRLDPRAGREQIRVVVTSKTPP